MADVKWIKLTVSMFDDEKIKIIESMPDKDAILIIWVKLLVLAGKTNASGYLYLSQNIPYTDEMLSTLFNRPLSTVRMALEVFQKFKMIDVNDNGFISIANWEKHQNIEGMEKIREQTRQRVAKYREQQKQLECNVTVTQSNATEEERRKKKEESKLKENTYSAFFESVWSLYPCKRGKGAIKETQIKRLYALGYEPLKKCIERYIKTKPDWQQYQNGSTFFNSGYKDFLDENFVDSKPQQQNDGYKMVE